MNDDTHEPWWRGTRGEWYVAIQIALFVLVAWGPRHLPGLSLFSPTWRLAARTVGITLMVASGLLALVAALHLGKNLTPLPRPKDNGQLVEHGAYRIVRHPIYAAAIGAAFGFAMFVQGTLTLGYAALLLLFLDVKSRREERWLRAKYPTYADYARRVRKLIPFVY